MIKNELIKGLDNNKKILKQFVSVMKDNEIRKRIKDYWTIYENLEHLVATQKMLIGRIEKFIAEEKPVMTPYMPEDKPATPASPKSAKELVNEFIHLRDMQLTLIKKAKGNVWKKEGVHPEYHKYSFEILLRHMFMHDSFHMWRMEELWIRKEDLIQELK